MSERHTHIVIGAGAAGCAVAARLSEDPDKRVLLLEAGGRDWNPLIHMPAGFTKLTGKIFADNQASVALVRRCGFREVGVHHRHGRLDGRWKDVLVVERLLGEAAS